MPRGTAARGYFDFLYFRLRVHRIHPWHPGKKVTMSQLRRNHFLPTAWRQFSIAWNFPRRLTAVLACVAATALLCSSAFALSPASRGLFLAQSPVFNQGLLELASAETAQSPVLVMSPRMAADSGSDPAYRTNCRCAPADNDFCQGTLIDTDIFLSADGMLLHGMDSNVCRLLWEYEFSVAIEKLAIDTTSQIVFFASGNSVYGLSLNSKQIVLSRPLPGPILNISIQPSKQLSVDLASGERTYIDISGLSSVAGSVEMNAANEDTQAPAGKQDIAQTDAQPSADMSLDIDFGGVAEVTFADDNKPSKHSKEPETSADRVAKNKDQEPEVKLYGSQLTQSPVAPTLKPAVQHSAPVEITDTGVNCLKRVSLKTKKPVKSKDIYINKYNSTMVSLDYLVHSGLCIDYEIKGNIIKIKGPGGKLITINNSTKTIQVGNNKPVKMSRKARTYRTKNGKFFIPVRLIMEQAGYSVGWSRLDKSVVISA